MENKENSRREKNKYLKIKKLLSSAFQLFIENGFDNTSIDEITKNSKVAKGTFYLYFKDKIDIRNKLIIEKSSEVFEMAYKHIQAKSYENREDKIIAFCDYIINYLSNDKALLNLIHKNISTSLYKEVLEKNDSDNIIVKVLNELQKEFEDTFTSEEFLINLFIILEMLGAVLYSSIIHKEPVEIEVIKPYLYRNIRKIIRKE
ncbi:TetR/AcrR family transcriptional regulator [Helcococcus kunzii]|uniref:TetR/AcrR family transcriptional regulator n=1 Tax=Helcococcus kunzii TaxID=40091 RepID=UPI0021A5E7EF|nr:TetR/AcrR family transcriptional regulator [Helcococcus kunzii]MCT1796354.1 TetR/AcrR family transcriptional regulator [Helcococcus kunzii]MCT1989404.1 TetR/AcrR family transcriptional regulator [Helcococcus kunzii]